MTHRRAPVPVRRLVAAETQIKPLLEELYVDRYPTLGDLIGGPYRALTGKTEPDMNLAS